MKNIVFIHAESMDGRKMGCMGDPAMQQATPNLDRLAREGVQFTSAYATCPVCNPSRASMWTGRYPHRYECWNNHEGIDHDTPTFQTALEQAGYHVQVFGKLDYQYGAHSIRDRVGSWTRSADIHRPLSRTPLPEVLRDDAQVHQKDQEHFSKASQWLLDRTPEDGPFMLWISPGLVHPAFRVHQKYLQRINQAAIELPPHDPTDHPVLRYQNATKNAPSNCPEELVHEIRLVYMAMIAELDELVGELLHSLERSAVGESTYVVFSSDHGEMAMEHGQILKRTMYEPSMHVPLLVAGPGVRPGAVVGTTVSLVDIYPTLMDIAEIELPSELDGESLLPQLTQDTPRTRTWAFGEYHGDRCNTGAFMLVQDDWKYIKYQGYEPLLFNLQEDPWEIDSRAHVEQGRVQQMDDILASFIDCAAVDAKAKAYDQASFRRWRQNELAAGTYAMSMARIYSGFEGLSIDDLQAWTDEDEAKIEAWLAT